MAFEEMTNEDFMITLEKIEMLMHYEKTKPKEEMDTALIDMCVSILAKAYDAGFEVGNLEEMQHPWENTTFEIKNESTVDAFNFCDMWTMSKEDEEEFSKENLAKMIKKERKKLWFLRDYGLIHECYLTLSEVYGHQYGNEYEKKAEKQIRRRKLVRNIKKHIWRKQS